MYKLHTGIVEITRKCCAKCIHCIIDAGEERSNELTSSEIIKLIEDFYDLGCKNVVLTGGEPFLREDWPLFVNKIRQLNMRPLFMTNAMPINDETIEVLKLYPNVCFGISLDGANKETHDYIRGVDGIFEHFCEIVPKLKAEKFYVAPETTVMQRNYDQLDDILNLLIDLKVDAWQIQIVKPNKRLSPDEYLTEQQYLELAKKIAYYRENFSDVIRIVEADCIGYHSSFQDKLEIKQWGGCSCGIHSVTVESDGNVKGCPNMNNSEGNIRRRPFKEIWADHNSFRYNRCPQVDTLEGFCAECKYKYSCRGGCPENPTTPSGNRLCLYKIETKGCD